MSNAELFRRWLEQNGAEARVTQEDDGNGYTIFEVAVPGLGDFEVTVND